MKAYRCARCRADIEDGFDRCWRCGEPVPADLLEWEEPSGAEPADPAEGADAVGGPAVLCEKTFAGSSADREALFREAAAFASGVGRGRLVSISHSGDGDHIVVAVWYWSDAPDGDA
jgi:hypothetical protein